MNTSKQVNVIIGLLFVGALATLLYYLWDGERQSDATERQMTENAERGGFIFARNCSSCHGLTGTGVQERGGLPGAPLNVEGNRLTAAGELAAAQTRFYDTIRCGRIGTLMPPWSQEQGGPLNNFQILQLVALITGTMPPQEGAVTQEDILADPNAISEAGWHNALETANHDSEFDPPKELAEAAGAETTTLVLNDPYGLSRDSILRIDDEPADGVYELVSVVDAPASSALTADISAQDAELPLENASAYRAGDVLIIQEEKVEVEAAPAATELVADVGAAETTFEVSDASGLDRGSIISVGQEKMRIRGVANNILTVTRAVEETEPVDQVAGAQVIEDSDRVSVTRGVEDTRASDHDAGETVLEDDHEIEVERGVEGSDAAEHSEGAHVFNGPALPGTTINGETGTPPCGQLPAEPAATPGPPIAVSGNVTMTAGDNFFELQGQRNPSLGLPAGQTVTIQLTNGGSQPHNLRTTGTDGEFDSDDDAVSSPDLIQGGGTGTANVTFAEAGTYQYRCDFHPDQMVGEITVTQ